MTVKLYILFLKYGLLCFGGGYALVPLLLNDLVLRYHWLDEKTFGTLVSIAQITPGPIGLNIATFCGWMQAGFWGALTASLGLLTPSLIFVTILVRSLHKWEGTRIVTGFLNGVKPVSLGLVICAAVIFWRMSVTAGEWFAINPVALLTAVGAAVGFYRNVSPILLILTGAAAGALLCGG